jgi:hypothetical protein
VRLQDCKIGHLAFYGNTGRLEVVGGEIRGLEVSPRSSPVFSGPVRLKRVDLPSHELQVQPLLEFEAALLRIHNLDTAGIVHAAERRLSRRTQPFTDRAISWLYDVGSEYGTNTAVPLLWFVILIELNVGFLMLSGGTVLSASDLVGWQEELAPGEPWSELHRAAYFTLRHVFSPLGILGTNPLVVSSRLWITLVSSVLCLLATLSFGLFLFAVRRRFRVGG